MSGAVPDTTGDAFKGAARSSTAVNTTYTDGTGTSSEIAQVSLNLNELSIDEKIPTNHIKELFYNERASAANQQLFSTQAVPNEIYEDEVWPDDNDG